MRGHEQEQIAGNADSTPLGLKVLGGLLSAFAIFAFGGSAFLWGRGFILDPPAGTSIALPLADILINAPASMVAGIGLWRLRRYGYLAGYFVAGLYLYASTFIIVEAFEQRPPDFWAILVPQLLAVVVAVALLVYLPRTRGYFR
jgi:hypothetical protein